MADGQNTPTVGQCECAKIFPFTEIRKRRICRRNPAQGRGAYRDRHERGPGGGGRGAHRRERHRRAGNRERNHRAHDRCDRRTAKSCRPGARGLCAKSCGDVCGPTGPRASAIRKATGAIVHRSPGRARHKPFQPSAQGRPGCPGYTCMPLCKLLTATPHSGPRVPAGSRSSLRPLSMRVRRSGKARAKCAARMRAHVSHATTLSCPGRCAARSDALRSRGPCFSVLCHPLGPGSAAHRYALCGVREMREAGAAPVHSVIASAAKQSRIFPRRQSGWLRCARNDEDEAAVLP